MSLKSLSLAVIGGGAAYVLFKAVNAQQPDAQPQVIYAQQPAKDNSRKASGVAKWLPFIDLAVNLLDAPEGQPIFDFGSGATTNPNGGGQALTMPQTGSSGGAGTQGLLDMIARYEGGVNGYDVVYGGSRIQPPRPITQMTVQQVRNWQDESVRAGSASSAVGKYQIIRKTMDLIISSGTIRRSELFDADCQERAGRYLLERRGYSQYQSGQLSETEFAQRLAQEWASLPAVTRDKQGRTASGQSYYAGDGLNRAHYGINDLMAAVRSL